SGSCDASASHEVLGFWVMGDDGAGRLLGVVLVTGVLAAFEADALTFEQLQDRLVVLEIGAGRIAPRVAPTTVLLAEQTGEGRAVLVSVTHLLTDPAMPQLAERLGHL